MNTIVQMNNPGGEKKPVSLGQQGEQIKEVFTNQELHEGMDGRLVSVLDNAETVAELAYSLFVAVVSGAMTFEDAQDYFRNQEARAGEKVSLNVHAVHGRYKAIISRIDTLFSDKNMEALQKHDALAEKFSAMKNKMMDIVAKAFAEGTLDDSDREFLEEIQAGAFAGKVVSMDVDRKDLGGLHIMKHIRGIAASFLLLVGAVVVSPSASASTKQSTHQTEQVSSYVSSDSQAVSFFAPYLNDQRSLNHASHQSTSALVDAFSFHPQSPESAPESPLTNDTEPYSAELQAFRLATTKKTQVMKRFGKNIAIEEEVLLSDAETYKALDDALRKNPLRDGLKDALQSTEKYDLGGVMTFGEYIKTLPGIEKYVERSMKEHILKKYLNGSKKVLTALEPFQKNIVLLAYVTGDYDIPGLSQDDITSLYENTHHQHAVVLAYAVQYNAKLSLPQDVRDDGYGLSPQVRIVESSEQKVVVQRDMYTQIHTAKGEKKAFGVPLNVKVGPADTQVSLQYTSTNEGVSVALANDLVNVQRNYRIDTSRDEEIVPRGAALLDSEGKYHMYRFDLGDNTSSFLPPVALRHNNVFPHKIEDSEQGEVRVTEKVVRADGTVQIPWYERDGKKRGDILFGAPAFSYREESGKRSATTNIVAVISEDDYPIDGGEVTLSGNVARFQLLHENMFDHEIRSVEHPDHTPSAIVTMDGGYEVDVAQEDIVLSQGNHRVSLQIAEIEKALNEQGQGGAIVMIRDNAVFHISRGGNDRGINKYSIRVIEQENVYNERRKIIEKVVKENPIDGKGVEIDDFVFDRVQILPQHDQIQGKDFDPYAQDIYRFTASLSQGGTLSLPFVVKQKETEKKESVQTRNGVSLLSGQAVVQGFRTNNGTYTRDAVKYGMEANAFFVELDHYAGSSFLIPTFVEHCEATELGDQSALEAFGEITNIESRTVDPQSYVIAREQLSASDDVREVTLSFAHQSDIKIVMTTSGLVAEVTFGESHLTWEQYEQGYSIPLPSVERKSDGEVHKEDFAFVRDGQHASITLAGKQEKTRQATEEVGVDLVPTIGELGKYLERNKIVIQEGGVEDSLSFVQTAKEQGKTGDYDEYVYHGSRGTLNLSFDGNQLAKVVYGGKEVSSQFVIDPEEMRIRFVSSQHFANYQKAHAVLSALQDKKMFAFVHPDGEMTVVPSDKAQAAQLMKDIFTEKRIALANNETYETYRTLEQKLSTIKQTLAQVRGLEGYEMIEGRSYDQTLYEAIKKYTQDRENNMPVQIHTLDRKQMTRRNPLNTAVFTTSQMKEGFNNLSLARQIAALEDMKTNKKMLTYLPDRLSNEAKETYRTKMLAACKALKELMETKQKERIQDLEGQIAALEESIQTLCINAFNEKDIHEQGRLSNVIKNRKRSFQHYQHNLVGKGDIFVFPGTDVYVEKKTNKHGIEQYVVLPDTDVAHIKQQQQQAFETGKQKLHTDIQSIQIDESETDLFNRLNDLKKRIDEVGTDKDLEKLKNVYKTLIRDLQKKQQEARDAQKQDIRLQYSRMKDFINQLRNRGLMTAAHGFPQDAQSINTLYGTLDALSDAERDTLEQRLDSFIQKAHDTIKEYEPQKQQKQNQKLSTPEEDGESDSNNDGGLLESQIEARNKEIDVLFKKGHDLYQKLTSDQQSQLKGLYQEAKGYADENYVTKSQLDMGKKKSLELIAKAKALIAQSSSEVDNGGNESDEVAEGGQKIEYQVLDQKISHAQYVSGKYILTINGVKRSFVWNRNEKRFEYVLPNGNVLELTTYTSGGTTVLMYEPVK